MELAAKGNEKYCAEEHVLHMVMVDEGCTRKRLLQRIHVTPKHFTSVRFIVGNIIFCGKKTMNIQLTQ